jgi:hypothetical protein
MVSTIGREMDSRGEEAQVGNAGDSRSLIYWERDVQLTGKYSSRQRGGFWDGLIYRERWTAMGELCWGHQARILQ